MPPKALLKVHPQTGPGVTALMGPPVQGKQSARIEAVTQEGVGGGVGVGVGAGGVGLLEAHRPLAGPDVGDDRGVPILAIGATKATTCLGIGPLKH